MSLFMICNRTYVTMLFEKHTYIDTPELLFNNFMVYVTKTHDS